MRGTDMQLRIGINGAAGRMGQRLIALIAAAPDDMRLVAAVEAGVHPLIGRDAGEVAGAGTLGVLIAASIKARTKPDVFIDFSAPPSTVALAQACARLLVPLVVGTTGLTLDQVSILRQTARKVPCVYAPNMSVGVNVLTKLVREAAAALGPDFDVEVIEAHHRFKKDAPSGTSIHLAKAAAEGRSLNYEQAAVHGRHGITGERKAEEIGMHAVRAGDIIGEHTVLFGGMGEQVELKHSVHNRDTFARGALRAARFVVGRKPALYSMEDVLGMK